MNSITKQFASVRNITISGLSLELARLLKFNMIIGSHCAFLSAASVVAPFVGGRKNLSVMAALTVLRSVVTSWFLSAGIGLQLLLHLPLFAGTLLYHASSRIAVISFFASAMGLFLLNPVGSHAWVYSMLWLIPILSQLFVRNALLTRALSSSFGAHAVGTLVYLYTGTISAEVWTALTPVALLERLVLTVGIMFMAQVVTYAEQNRVHIKNAIALLR